MSHRGTGRRPTWPVTSRQGRATVIPFEVKAVGSLPFDSVTNFADLTGYVFAAQVRAYARDNAILATLTVVTTNLATGRFVVTATEALLANMPFGEHRWDLAVTPPGAETDSWVDVSPWEHLPTVTP